MKKEIYDIREMSDSKEIYGFRPNKFLAAFIYTLALLLVTAVIYVATCNIDVTAKAAGIVRPNDDVATVSAMVGGKVTEVSYKDGQTVVVGDSLLSIDMAETEISLEHLQEQKEDYEREKELLGKYVSGLQTGNNPFSVNPSSDEYRYYMKFQTYHYQQTSSILTRTYDLEKAKKQLEMLKAQQKEIKYTIAGWQAYQNSILQGKNLAEDYPEYGRMYELYAVVLETLEREYQVNQRELEAGTDASFSQHYLNYYNGQIERYRALIQSIKAGTDKFSKSDTSYQKLLYEEYVANLTEYERAYAQSVSMEAYYKEHKQTEENPTGFTFYEVSQATAQKMSDKNAIEIYRMGKLSTFTEILEELEEKYIQYNLESRGISDKDTLKRELEEAYRNQKKQLRIEKLSEIDSVLISKKSELLQIEASIAETQQLEAYYEDDSSQEGRPISVEISKAEEITSAKDSITQIEESLLDLSSSIETAKEQIAAGGVLAQKDGVLHVLETVVAGDVIGSGTEIATILPVGENKFKVQLYVSNSDIADIAVGDEIKYNLNALPSAQYGKVSGTVTKISKDTMIQDGTYSGYFLVEGTIDQLILTDKDGNQGEISIGMELEAKIVTEKKKILRYLLETIDIW